MLRMVLQIGAQITLARVLGPEQYGVFAIGATAISFSAFFSDIGLAYGLIQKSDVTARDVRFVFTWQIILGTLVGALVWLAAGPISAFFGERRAAPVLEVLSVLCLLNALAAPSLNLLKRQLDFKQIHIAQLASYVIGYVMVGIPMALGGSQVWALVVAWVVQASVSLLLLYRATGHSLKPLLWYEQARTQSGYGGAVLATNLVNWVINNIDRIVVGRAFGSRDIGLYATSYNLFYNPSAAVLGVVQPVFFSASSRVSDDPGRILRGYMTLLATVTMVVLPVFVLVATASDAFIAMLYGPKWAAAAALCKPIALAMPLFLMWGFTTPLLWTSGKVAREVQIQLPLAIMWCLACVIAASYSVEAVAWSVLALSAARCGLVMTTATRLMQIPARNLWVGARGGLLVSALVAAVVALVANRLASASPGVRMAACSVSAVLVWLAMLRVAPDLVSNELAQLFGKLLDRSPPRLHSLLAFLAHRRLQR